MACSPRAHRSVGNEWLMAVDRSLSARDVTIGGLSKAAGSPRLILGKRGVAAASENGQVSLQVSHLSDDVSPVGDEHLRDVIRHVDLVDI